MNKKQYLTEPVENAAEVILAAIDKDVERGEDIVMFGFCAVMLSSTFAPIAPPSVVLPMVAVTFALSSSLARINYHNMERRLLSAMAFVNEHDRRLLRPIVTVFNENPMHSLTISFNPAKNIKRTLKSIVGGILINPFWMPIFYVMGMQIIEEKNLGLLNRAIIGVEQKILHLPLSD
ncbi:MAG: hypothetical protein ABL919_14575 [Methylococcales bacterium]|nr:hypothetical protein [Methylococcaceae bacterium]